jgi:hypothetical protein
MSLSLLIALDGIRGTHPGVVRITAGVAERATLSE